MTDTDISPLGDTLESTLDALGIRDEVYAQALKSVIAFQIDEARKARSMSKTALAEALHTSRTQVDRLLDPDNPEVSLASLERVARAVGKVLKIELQDA